MIYLKENKINKFGCNKIYLKDKLIYQTVKEPTLEPPTYLKSAFAYDSFAGDVITDVITNTKYRYGLYGYKDFNFAIKDHYNTIYQNGTYRQLQTKSSREPIFKDFKSLLIKCGNVIQNSAYPFQYTQKTGTNFEYFKISKRMIEYGTYKLRYDSIDIKNIYYIYIDFNGGTEKSTIRLLDNNMQILKEENGINTFNLSTNEDVGYYNSLFFVSFYDENNSTNPIDFYYQCYCDKFLSIDEIKELDNYMMKR